MDGDRARVVNNKQTITAKGPKNLSQKALTAAAAGCKAVAVPLQLTHSGGGGSASRKQLVAANDKKATPLKLVFGGKGGASSDGSGGQSAQGPIHPKSTLARNVVSLLASAPGQCLSGADFPKAYAARFKVKLDYQGGQLKDLLDRLEAGGSCSVRKQQMPKGPPLVSVHSK